MARSEVPSSQDLLAKPTIPGPLTLASSELESAQQSAATEVELMSPGSWIERERE